MPLDLADAIAAELGEGKQASKEDRSAEDAGEAGFCNLAAAISAELGPESGGGQRKAGPPAAEPPTNGRHARASGPAPAAGEAGYPQRAEAERPLPADAEKAPDEAPAPATDAAAASASRTSRFASFAQGGGAVGAGVTVPEQPEEPELPFAVRDEVEVFGLKTQFGEQLNGQIGHITKWVERKGRFMVRFGAGESDVNLRPENLRVPGSGPDDDGADAEAAATPAAAAAGASGGAAAAGPAQPAGAPAPAAGGGASGSASAAGPGPEGAEQPCSQEKATAAAAAASGDASKAEESAASEPSKGDASSPLGAAQSGGQGEDAFREGDAVQLHGLSSADGQRLNGQKGAVQRFISEKARFEVRLESGEMANVKLGNLQRLVAGVGEAAAAAEARAPAGAADAAAGAADAAPAGASEATPAAAVGKEEAGSAEPPLATGDTVEVFGLESEGGRKLNGKRGVLGEFDEAKSRFQVDLETGATVSLKSANLKKVEPPPSLSEAGFSIGDAVEVSGLTSEAGKKLNGQRGLVVKYDDKTGRFELRCQFGNTVSVKPANMELVCSASAGAEAPDESKTQADAPESQEPPFGCGDVVTVAGLQSESGKALNGQVGVVGKCDQEGGRIEILFASADPAKLKPANLRRLSVRKVDESAEAATAAKDEATSSRGSDAHPAHVSCGDNVEVFGLESEKGKLMNGQTGVVKAYSSEKQRFEVSLASGALVHLKPENIRRVSPGASEAGAEAPESEEDDDFPREELMDLNDEDKLASIQQQLLEAMSTAEVQAQLDELRAGSKNMRQYGRELESVMRPIRNPVYRRHGINREWHLRTAEESSAESQAREERLMELCAFTPVGRSEQEQPSGAGGSAGSGA